MVAADLSKTNELEESFLRTPEEEKRIIRELTNSKEANWKEGDTYYVISNRWWRKWQKYVGADESDNGFDGYSDSSQHKKFPFSKDIFRPGLIDNSDIMLNGVDSEGDPMGLRPMLQEEHDYVLVPQIVWKKLFQWYDGGPAIPRKVISHGNLYKSLVVEVYPLCLHLVDSRDNSLSTIWISKMATVGELYSTICHRSNLRKEEVQIWDYFNKEKHQLLSDYDKTLEETQLQLDQYILLEMANDRPLSSGNRMDSTGNEMALVTVEPLRPFGLNAEGATLSNGISPKHTSVVRKNSLDSLLTVGGDEHEPLRSDSKGNGRGLTGLLNLGNTCFMNSALQCLVHTSPLVEYFLQDYRNEINSINPLGMSGQLAVAFGNLLRQLWSAGQTPIAPRVFKGKLSRFAPQFSGYNQHDSQELLAFLLDGLHEDLNRVKHKPYIEARDADGRPDVIVADECWANHKARNDSIIVDVCQGQYKSTLVCPVCAKVSVTFDPFMYLSLPLPSTATRVMTVTVLACDGSALPMPYTVNVQKHGYCRDLTRALSSACCLEKGECLLLAEVYEHQICRYIENSESLSVIKDDEHIVAYRLSAKHEKLPRIEIMHRNKDRTTLDRPNIGHQEFFGTPLVSCLNEDNLTGNDLQATIRVLLMPLLRKKSAYIGCLDKESVPSSIKSDSYPTSEDMDMVSSSNSAFQIWLLRDQGFSRSAIENDAQINLSACIKVVLDWFEREHKLYDTSYLEDLPEVFKSGLLAKKTRSEAISLFSCLEAFLKEEPLGPDDMWYCPRCKEHRQATKKLDLWKLPEILVVHLKRFSYNRFLKNKIDTFVSFPVQRLDLSKYVNHTPNIPQSHVYELYAVSNHYGGLGGGHYSAFVKLIEENRWYHFDDSHVSPINEDGIKTAAAYVLFYRRIKEDPSSSHSL